LAATFPIVSITACRTKGTKLMKIKSTLKRNTGSGMQQIQNNYKSQPGAETQRRAGEVIPKILGGGDGAAYIPLKISEIFNQI